MIQGGDFTEGMCSDPDMWRSYAFISYIELSVLVSECDFVCLGNGRGGESIYGGFFEGKPFLDAFCSLSSTP